MRHHPFPDEDARSDSLTSPFACSLRVAKLRVGRRIALQPPSRGLTELALLPRALAVALVALEAIEGALDAVVRGGRAVPKAVHPT